jgi:UDP-galactopyranose mutase
LAESGRGVLVLEKRKHIGGNCFDTLDDAGVMIHQYGAHIFHTDHEDVWDYLSNFTQWRPYQHEVVSHVGGDPIPIPFNFNSIEAVYPEDAPGILDTFVEKYGPKTKISVLELLNESCPVLREVGEYVYENIFKNYTLKQWGLKPDQIAPEVIARVPVYTDHDNRYFTDKYQGIPQNGYTAMIGEILSHPNIDVRLNTPFQSRCKFKDGAIYLDNTCFHGTLVYTGKTDTLFDYEYGHLPYRSLTFEFETHEADTYQSHAVINYPNDHDFTRIIEAKHMTGQACSNTTICREYPHPYHPDRNEPYYPLSTADATQQYEQYAEKARHYDNLVLAGRLAEYRYYDMDDAVKNALDLARNLLS